MTENYVAASLASKFKDEDLPLVEAPAVELPRARYRFADGTVVTIRGIAQMLLYAAQSEVGKPQPPAREVRMAGGGVQLIPRRDDEPVLTPEQIAKIADPAKRREEEEYARYRAELNQWDIERNTRMARLLFIAGVEDSPPPEIADLWKQMGFTGEMEIKYAWLASKLPNAEAMAHFFETVTSLTVPTEDGLERAEAMFQSAVSGSSGGTVGTAEPAAGAPGQARAEEAQTSPAATGDPADAPVG